MNEIEDNNKNANIKDVLRSMIMTFSIYSKIPMPNIEWKEENMKAYIKIVDKLNKLLEWLVVVVLVILSFVVLAQVVTRKCHISVAWLEEMARYSMIWLCFLGAAVACRRGSLIKIDILYELLPQKVSRYFLYFVDVLSIVFLVVALYSCSQYLPLGFNSSASSMKSIKMFWFYLCMPIGMGMMFLNIIANILERMKGGPAA